MIGLITISIGLFVYWLHPVFFDNIDLRVRDTVHLYRDLPEPHPNIAVVTVDEKSISTLGRWPWSRALQAELILAVKKANAKVISLDIVYSSQQTADTDQNLINAIEAVNSLTVGGYFFRDQQSILPEQSAMDVLFNQRIKAVFNTDKTNTIKPQIKSNYVETNIPNIQAAFDGLGFSTISLTRMDYCAGYR